MRWSVGGREGGREGGVGHECRQEQIDSNDGRSQGREGCGLW